MLAPLTIPDITQIRTLRQQVQPVVSGSDYMCLVRETGLEPVRHRHTPLKRACLPIPALSQVLYNIQ